MNPRTKARLETRIKETVAQVILRDLADPRIGFVTVTAVDLSPELDVAKIFVSVLGSDGDRRKCMDGLNAAHGLVQEVLGRVLHTRRTPRVRFEYDESIANADRIGSLIRRARQEDDAAARARGELDEDGQPFAGEEDPDAGTEDAGTKEDAGGAEDGGTKEDAGVADGQDAPVTESGGAEGASAPERDVTE